MDDVTKQLKLILCKLDGLETKLETVIETVNNVKTTVNKLENVVIKYKGTPRNLEMTSMRWIKARSIVSQQ